MRTTDRDILWPGWETVRLIGRGSFGAVYEIQRDVLGDIEKAALKVISIPQNASDIDEMYSDGYDDASITSTFQSHLKSIVSEYSLMRKMNGCTNVVNCDDVRYVQHDDGFGWDIFIKMELLTPIAKTLPSQVPEETVIQIGKDICTALELCKKHEIVHRDVKPQNIFVSPNGDYKLGDFGIAKTVEKTSGGTKIGTYKYMAPEVYNNQPYGSAADIYSLGLVLYWMLNERRMPFLPLPPVMLSAGMDEAARARRLSGEQFAEPKHGSKQLKAVVMKACAYNIADRYTSATEMLNDLKQIGQSNSVNTAPQNFNAVPLAPEMYEEADRTVGVFGGPAPKAAASPEIQFEEDRTVGVFTSAAPKIAVIPDIQPEEDRTVGVFASAAPKVAAIPDTQPEEEGTIGLFSKPAVKQPVVPEPVKQNKEPEEKPVSVKKPEIAAADNQKTSPIPEKKNSAEPALVPKKNKKKLPIIIGAAAAVLIAATAILIPGLMKNNNTHNPKDNNTQNQQSIIDQYYKPAETQKPTSTPTENVTKPTTAPVTNVTLKVWSPESNANAANSWMGQVQRQFEDAHPEYNITWVNEVCVEHEASNMVASNPAAAADVYLFANDQLGSLIQAGAITQLDGSYLAQVKKDFSSTYVSTVTASDGGVYGFPIATNTWFMYYNKSVLTKQDVKSMEACLKKGIVAFPLKNTWYLSSFFFASGGTLFGESGADASAGINFGGKIGTNAVNAILDLTANPNFVITEFDLGTQLLMDGSAVACFSGSWDYYRLYEALGEDLGAVAAPTVMINGAPAQLKAFASTKAIGVNPHSSNLEAAMQFAAFLASPDSQLLYYQVCGATPAASILANHPDIAGSIVAAAEANTMLYASVPQPNIPEMMYIWGPMDELGNAIANGQVTRGNAGKMVEDMINKASQ